MMNQFRVHRTSGGQLYIYEWSPGKLEHVVCMRQFNRHTGRWE